MSWLTVSTVEPCSICGKPDWCSRSDDGTVVLCRRVAEPGAVSRSDKSGVEYHLHFNGSKPEKGKEFDPYALAEPELEGEPTRYQYPAAPPDDRDRAYRVFLAALDLRSSHRRDLENRRRIPAEAIDVFGYRSFPTSLEAREAAMKAVRQHCGSLDRLLRIPGFTVVELKQEFAEIEGEMRFIGPHGEVKKRKADIPRYDGTVVPVRDLQGRILALKIRLDDDSAGKMRMFNCRTAEGSGLPLQVHVPLHPFIPTERVRITEGEIKADVATMMTGTLTLGLPSAGAWRLALPILRELGTKVVVLAYDADASTKKGVAGPLARCALYLAERGYEVEVETWSYQLGKGIDDVVAGGMGANIKTLGGKAAWREIGDRLKAAGHPVEAQISARAIIADLVARASGDAAYALQPDVIEAWVVLDLAPDRRALEELLEAALKGKVLTQWRRLVAAERRKVREEQKARSRLRQEEAEREAIQQGEVVLARGDAVELGIRLLAAIAPKDRNQKPDGKLVVYDEGDLYLYDKDTGLWAGVSLSRQSRIIQRFAGARVRGLERPLRINSTREAISMAHDQVEKEGFFADAPPGIAFANGFVTIHDEGPRLGRHSPEQRARHRYEFDFEPDAQPHRLVAAAAQWFDGAEDADQRVQTIQEFFGLSLLGLAPRLGGIALVLLGAGANGKSTLIETIEACFPPDSTASVIPHDWTNEQKVAGLAGKLLNVVGELPARDLQETSTFKAVITGERVQGKVVYRPPFFFLSMAGHVFAANALLGAGDLSHGFFRRFTIVAFERTFALSEQDRGFAKAIIEAERPAIVSWLLRGAASAIQRGRLCDPPPSADTLKAKWKIDSDPVRRFLVEATEDEPVRDRMARASGLYEQYRDWAEKNGHTGRLASNTFGMRAKAIIRDWALDCGDKRLSCLQADDRRALINTGCIETKRGNFYPVRLRADSDTDDELPEDASEDAEIRRIMESI